jgi:hypothetical protein
VWFFVFLVIPFPTLGWKVEVHLCVYRWLISIHTYDYAYMFVDTYMQWDYMCHFLSDFGQVAGCVFSLWISLVCLQLVLSLCALPVCVCARYICCLGFSGLD